MKRIIEPELLDELPPGDPRAVRSRRDLCRVNAWMRNHDIMAGALQSAFNGRTPEQITELGAGDGNFLLQVAQRLSALGVPPLGGGRTAQSRVNAELLTPNRLKPGQQTVAVSATLLDRQSVATPQTLSAFTALGWRAETVVADVFDWPPGPADIVIANLFLHHFNDARLAGLLRVIASRARLFIAVEPSRTPWPLFCSRLLWAIRCNAVTRHDAVVSVRAGFANTELSALWPDKQSWRLTEEPAGLASHLFIAQKI